MEYMRIENPLSLPDARGISDRSQFLRAFRVPLSRVRFDAGYLLAAG
jgi:hypothetical protein